MINRKWYKVTIYYTLKKFTSWRLFRCKMILIFVHFYIDKAFEVGFCAKPTKYDLTLFSPWNNHTHPNLAASHTGECPSCSLVLIFRIFFKKNNRMKLIQKSTNIWIILKIHWTIFLFWGALWDDLWKCSIMRASYWYDYLLPWRCK